MLNHVEAGSRFGASAEAHNKNMSMLISCAGHVLRTDQESRLRLEPIIKQILKSMASQASIYIPSESKDLNCATIGRIARGLMRLPIQSEPEFHQFIANSIIKLD